MAAIRRAPCSSWASPAWCPRRASRFCSKRWRRCRRACTGATPTWAAARCARSSRRARPDSASATGSVAAARWRRIGCCDAYRRADLFVLASRIAPDGDRDGLPNVLLEAGALQLAAVASRIAAIPELIEDGVNGRLVPPGEPRALAEALAALIGDPAPAPAPRPGGPGPGAGTLRRRRRPRSASRPGSPPPSSRAVRLRHDPAGRLLCAHEAARSSDPLGRPAHGAGAAAGARAHRPSGRAREPAAQLRPGPAIRPASAGSRLWAAASRPACWSAIAGGRRAHGRGPGSPTTPTTSRRTGSGPWSRARSTSPICSPRPRSRPSRRAAPSAAAMRPPSGRSARADVVLVLTGSGCRMPGAAGRAAGRAAPAAALPRPAPYQLARAARERHRAELAARFGLDPARPWLLVVAMMRADVKRCSYLLLAEALASCGALTGSCWWSATARHGPRSSLCSTGSGGDGCAFAGCYAGGGAAGPLCGCGPLRLARRARGLRHGDARGAGRRPAGGRRARGRRRRHRARRHDGRADATARSRGVRRCRRSLCSKPAAGGRAWAGAAARFVAGERSHRAGLPRSARGGPRGGAAQFGRAAMRLCLIRHGPHRLERGRPHPGPDRHRLLGAGPGAGRRPGACRRLCRGAPASPARCAARGRRRACWASPTRPATPVWWRWLGRLRGPHARRAAPADARRLVADGGPGPRFPAARRREPARGRAAPRRPACASWRGGTGAGRRRRPQGRAARRAGARTRLGHAWASRRCASTPSAALAADAASGRPAELGAPRPLALAA